MSIEQISGESVNDSTLSLPSVSEVTEVLQEEKAAASSPRASKETMRKVKAGLVYQENLRGVTAVPPWIQIAREKQRIKTDSKLKELIGETENIKIKKTTEGYTVFTENHRVDVTIKYLPIDYCGPAEFKLEFGDVLPLNKETSA